MKRKPEYVEQERNTETEVSSTFRATKFDTMKKERVRCSVGLRPKTSDSVKKKIRTKRAYEESFAGYKFHSFLQLLESHLYGLTNIELDNSLIQKFFSVYTFLLLVRKCDTRLTRD